MFSWPIHWMVLKMPQKGKTFLNSSRQQANENIVLKCLLYTDISRNIIPRKFQVDISYSSGDTAFWNVYHKDLQYISRPSDYTFCRIQTPFRILQIPTVRIPHFTDSGGPHSVIPRFTDSAIYRFHSVPQFADSIPFRRMQMPPHKTPPFLIFKQFKNCLM